MSIEIGENLKYERYEFQELGKSTLKIKDISQQIKTIDINQVKHIELAGIKSNSGYCGTTEWGMSNPTIILPTNFFFNIINLFKRKDDVVYFKIKLESGSELMILGNKTNFDSLHKRVSESQ